MHHQSLVLSVELYHQRRKPVQEVLQGLSLILFHLEEVERDGGWSSIDYELFPEQCRELIERGYVSIRETNEPIQCCAYERPHEQFTMHGVCSS